MWTVLPTVSLLSCIPRNVAMDQHSRIHFKFCKHVSCKTKSMSGRTPSHYSALKSLPSTKPSFADFFYWWRAHPLRHCATFSSARHFLAWQMPISCSKFPISDFMKLRSGLDRSSSIMIHPERNPISGRVLSLSYQMQLLLSVLTEPFVMQ